MKSLIRCEWTTLRTFLPSIAVTTALMCFLLVLGSGEMTGACGAAVATMMIVASSFAGYDDQNGWMRYRCAMPFSRRELAGGRYAIVALVGLALGAVCFALTCVTGGVLGLVGYETKHAELADLLLGGLAAEGVGLVIVSIGLPLHFKFGAMRGVRIFACVGLALSGLLVLVASFTPREFFSAIDVWTDSNAVLLATLVVIASLTIYMASCALSVWILERKDL